MISIVQVTNKHYLDTEYLTVAECLRRNGYRHYCNGMKYLEQGMTKHAFGSFAKAQRNYDRANTLCYEETANILPEVWNTLAKNVAIRIFGIDYGTDHG